MKIIWYYFFFSSLVLGLVAEVPSTMGFQQNFKSGSCLTIGWSSGRIQHFPIIYSDLGGDFNGSLSPQRIQNVSS